MAPIHLHVLASALLPTRICCGVILSCRASSHEGARLTITSISLALFSSWAFGLVALILKGQGPLHWVVIRLCVLFAEIPDVSKAFYY